MAGRGVGITRAALQACPLHCPAVRFTGVGTEVSAIKM